MKIYLDTCCWNRPLDDQSQNRVRIEAEAVLIILEMAQANELKIIGSDIIDDELSQMPDDERLEKIELLLTLASSHTSLTSAIEQRAMELTKSQITPLDALHLASAENAQADYFLTTDDDLLRRCRQAQLKVHVENPAQWFIHYNR